jgi:hypothetical protein
MAGDRDRCHQLRLPFCLLAYATLSVTAGLASILNATSPLWGALVARVWLKDQLDRGRILGLALGFAGIAFLFWGRASFKPGGAGLAVVAALVATLSYGVAASYAKRRLSGLDPLAVAAGSQLAAALLLVAPAIALWPVQPVPPRIIGKRAVESGEGGALIGGPGTRAGGGAPRAEAPRARAGSPSACSIPRRLRAPAFAGPASAPRLRCASSWVQVTNATMAAAITAQATSTRPARRSPVRSFSQPMLACEKKPPGPSPDGNEPGRDRSHDPPTALRCSYRAQVRCRPPSIAMVSPVIHPDWPDARK